jgi:hypothetical protein
VSYATEFGLEAFYVGVIEGLRVLHGKNVEV